MLLDYDDNSYARVYNNVTGEVVDFKGLEGIRNMSTGLFADLSDLSTLKAPVVTVEEDGKQVFLVWSCAGCGYQTATDTFIFSADYKILRQNIVVTKTAVGDAKFNIKRIKAREILDSRGNPTVEVDLETE